MSNVSNLGRRKQYLKTRFFYLEPWIISLLADTLLIASRNAKDTSYTSNEIQIDVANQSWKQRIEPPDIFLIQNNVESLRKDIVENLASQLGQRNIVLRKIVLFIPVNPRQEINAM